MSTADPTTDRMTITTPRGNTRVGDVVNREWYATAEEKHIRITVEVDGHRFIVTDD